MWLFYNKNFLVLIFIIPIFLRTLPAQAAGECDDLQSVNAILLCALERAPESVRASRLNIQNQELESIARQRPNIELSSSGTMGMQLGDIVAQGNIDLTHTFELGDKRDARIEKARGEIANSEANLLQAKEKTIMATLGALYRLRQIEVENHVISEALTTFEKILRQFKSRPRLGPEQEVSLGVFQLASSDYLLRKSSLEAEKTEVLQTLKVLVGKPFEPNIDALPAVRTSWPSVETPSDTPFAGSGIKFFQADLMTAKGELELQKSESWPNLKIGPSYQVQMEGPIKAHMFGLNLTFAIPLFHANGGGRDFGYKGVARAEVGVELANREFNARREYLKVLYERITKALQSTLAFSEMEKRHRSTDTLFERGVIPSSLVIEAHRQMVDFTSNRNQQELTALRSLWELRAIHGKLVAPENWEDL